MMPRLVTHFTEKALQVGIGRLSDRIGNSEKGPDLID
jgi:hypothetical protein